MRGVTRRTAMCKLALLLLGLTLAVTQARARSETVEDYFEGFVTDTEIEREKEIYPEVDCLLPSQRGHCRALIIRWKYDVATKDCREFKFGGCRGNANNFFTKKQCMKACKGV